MKLNFKQKQIHERAKSAAVKYHRAEVEMLQALQNADRVRLHKCFGLSSLSKYAISELKLSEPVAFIFIAVARKALEVPALQTAIVERKLSASGAGRLVSTITKENADELIEFAATHSWRQTERELARRNPRAGARNKSKSLGNGLVELTLIITEDQLKEFERACSVEAQRTQSAPKPNEVFVAAVRTHLEKYDPVCKADRAKKRADRVVFKTAPAEKHSERTESAVDVEPKCGERADVAEQPSRHSERTDKTVRVPRTAEQTHAVNLRDQGRCTHIDANGKGCCEDRWVEIHHIRPVSQGGTNDIDNLTTLCGAHHDLIHQLTLPIEGQFTYFR